MSRRASVLLFLSGVLASASNLIAAPFTEGFNNLGAGQYQPSGWSTFNRSEHASTSSTGYWLPTSMLQTPITPYEGNNAIGVSALNSVTTFSGVSTLNVWLVSPVTTWANGDAISFATKSLNVAGPPQDVYPDRMQVRLSLSGTSTNVGNGPLEVGDFSTLLLDINPTLAAVGSSAYPVNWQVFTATVSGLSAPTSGRLAFRYFVPNGGWDGANSLAVFVDDLRVTSVPEPSFAITAIALLSVLGRRRCGQKFPC